MFVHIRTHTPGSEFDLTSISAIFGAVLPVLFVVTTDHEPACVRMSKLYRANYSVGQQDSACHQFGICNQSPFSKRPAMCNGQVCLCVHCTPNQLGNRWAAGKRKFSFGHKQQPRSVPDYGGRVSSSSNRTTELGINILHIN